MSRTAAPRFGAHMPTAGGLHTAFAAGAEVGCEVIQIFTKSPQQWKARELTDEDVARFRQAQQETGIACLASHDTYLINPAAADPELLQKSRDALADELVRSTRLGIPFVVMHLGATGGAPEEEALDRLVASVRYALEHAPADGSVLLLETTAGQGSCLGHRFEHLARVLEGVNAGDRLAVCLDTCHVFAAGYDLREEASYAEAMAEFERLVGMARVRLIHANDSQRELGSRVDRHSHIGKGQIGLDGFRLLLRDPRLAEVPVVLETPRQAAEDKKVLMDPTNLAALRAAALAAVE